MEALGLREAISWLIVQDVSWVIIEQDAKGVVDTFHSAKPDISEFDNLMSECQDLLSTHSFILTHVKRQTNGVVDALAKATLQLFNSCSWSSAPAFMSKSLLVDVTVPYQ